MIVWVEKSNLENFRRNIYNLQGSKCKISEKKIWPSSVPAVPFCSCRYPYNHYWTENVKERAKKGKSRARLAASASRICVCVQFN